MIYEEYKGNFDQARRIAEAVLSEARRRHGSESTADALFARGIVHLLQGEPPAALKCFQEVEQTVPADYDRRLRAVNYSGLATSWQYNFFPDGGGAGGAELSARWNGVDYLKSVTPHREALFREARGSLVRFESSMLRDLLTNLYPSRSFLHNGRYNAPEATVGELLQAALQSPIDFHQTAELSDADLSLLAYADQASADLCKRAGNMQVGFEFLERALATYRQNKDVAGMAACHMMMGDWFSAPFSSPLVWNFAIQEGSSSGSDLAWTLESSEFDFHTAEIDRAVTEYDEAEKLFKSAQSIRGIAQIHLRRDFLAIQREDYPAAIGYATTAQQYFEESGDRLGFRLAQTHRILGRICAGQYPEESRVSEEIGAWGAGEGSFSYALGLGLMMGRAGRHWMIRKGDHERALACYRLAERLYRRLGAITNQAQSLVDQGSLCRALGERDTALTLFEEALEKYHDSSNTHPATAQALRPRTIMLANDVYLLCLDKMDADGMERSAKRLEALKSSSAGDIDGQDLIARLLGGGLTGLLSGTETGAGLEMIENFALDNLIRSTTEQARVLVPLYRARKERDCGNQAQAGRLFVEAHSAAQSAGDAQRSFLEAQVYAHQKDYGQAAEAFRTYLTGGGANAGFTGDLASLMQNLGGEQGRREVIRQDERTLEQAFSFMVRVKAYTEAKGHLDELIELAGSDWWDRDMQPWLNLSNCGEMYEGLGDFENAIDFYQRAISNLESRRNSLSRDELKTALAAGSGQQYLYFQAARTAATAAQKSNDSKKAGYYSAMAFNFIEQGKSRALLDLMAGSMAIAGSSKAEGESLKSWRECNSRLALWRGLLAQERSGRNPDQNRILQLEKQIDAQQVDLELVEAELSRSNPDFRRVLGTTAEILPAEKVCAMLPSEGALIQFAFLGEDLLTWGLTSQGVVKLHRSAVDANLLAREIRSFHNACMGQQEIESIGSSLTRTLLMPMEEIIRDYTRLAIVPYGPSHALPFHALPWKGKPFGHERIITYLPSASALQFISSEEGDRSWDRILAIGNPKAMAYRQPLKNESVPARDLPAAEVEAAFVASLFPGGKALIGEEATEEAARNLLGDYQLIHFATHGILAEDNPLLSAILLANGEAISVYELSGLKLNADLVVLSACQTGLGKVTGGDDVIGMTRGLLGAGARAALVSLWPVNDLSTSLLMGEFYRLLRSGKAPAACLSEAQNYLRNLDPEMIAVESAKLRDAGYARHILPAGAIKTDKDYSHPYYWAPFILVG